MFEFVGKNKLSRNISGFSLTEMSTVMVIIGFIAASALSVAITSDYASKRDETESKLDRIEEALAGFVAINHRLPCPASGTVAMTASGFGVEITPTTTSSGCNGADFSDLSTGKYVNAGVVPVTTLQLPDDFMFDGWGRRIDYAVDHRFTNSGTTNTDCSDANDVSGGQLCFRDQTSGSITVNNQSGAARTTTAVYALISHGENGHGAFPKPGSSTAARLNGFPAGNPYRDATASADEFTNAKMDNSGASTTYTATFVMRDYARNDDTSAIASARTYFDDQVRYREKSQIVKAVGSVFYDYICKIASDVINSTNYCAGATDNTQCEIFAAEINSRCIQ